MKSREIKASQISEGDDLIGTLPDHILCHILSFLPTKFAVLTSILSKRWMHLFASALDIDLDDSLLLHPGDSSFILNPEVSRPGIGNRFKVFVTNVLLARNSTNINRFHLYCKMVFDCSTISGWISDVLLLNVRKLDISVRMEAYRVPHEIFTCRSLESLRLCFGMHCVLTGLDTVILPNLKVLRLKYITFTGNDSIRSLFLGCPALEKLNIFLCQCEDVETFEISIPSLKNLDLSFRCVTVNSVVLDTPNLQYFVCGLFEPLVFLVKNTKSLISAEIATCSFNGLSEEDKYMCENVAMLINEINHVKSLSLSFASLTAVYTSPCSLAKFQNLTYMELNTSDAIGYCLLPELLESCPNLEVLSFPEGFISLYGPETDVEYRLPESVPLCFSRSLKLIKIGDFRGREYEFELVSYFLKNGGVLLKMMIGWEVLPVSRMSLRKKVENSGECPEWVSPTCSRLSKASRISETCQVVISWKEVCFPDQGEKLCQMIL